MQRLGLNGAEIEEVVAGLKSGKTLEEAMQKHGNVAPEWLKANKAHLYKLAGLEAEKPQEPEEKPKHGKR